MKKLLLTVLLIVTVLTMVACGGGKGKSSSKQELEIPDVFGINYTDAKEILEAEGFEVKTVEASVEGISEKLLYPLEKVKKGIVFKVDDYILDNLGNLTKNYDVFYDGEFVSDDGSLVVYYADEDYFLVEDNTETEPNDSESESPVPDTTETPVSDTTLPSVTDTTEQQNDSDAIDPEFKAAMDSYENFMNEYVEFMKKYQNNPTDLGLLADYADYMSKYADFVADFSKWENEEMNTAETAYYIDVQARVSKKLLEVA